MKRTFSVVLVLLTALFLFAAAAFAEGTDDLNAAALELNHKVYEANQLDSLFTRHESASYTFTYPLDPDSNGFVWETKDCIYQEWGTYSAEFAKDRLVYRMGWDEETGALNVFGGVNVSPEYAPFYCYAGGTEEDFFDAEQEHYLQIYEEDGLIYGVSRFDEELSQMILEGMGIEYQGQTIRTEGVMDAESYDAIKNAYIMEQDGEDTLLWETTVRYDEPEPAGSHTLRGAFERESEHLVTVTFVVDPGTDHEFTRALTVPANTEAATRFGNVPSVYFNDPDCETLFSWDCMSDVSLYVFTDPDEEKIEKFDALVREIQGK